jgi:hypothetical protein
MADDRPITPEQALLAVKAAGLDPDKALAEQLTPTGPDEETVKGWVREALGEAASQEPAATTPAEAEQQFARRQADAPARAQSKWINLSGRDDAA